jgi:capsular polysaccharide transport system permease protein
MIRVLSPSSWRDWRESSSSWRQTLAERLKSLRVSALRSAKPTALSVGLLLVALSGVYSFGIGRSRFQSSSDFLVRQPAAPGVAAPSVIGSSLGGPSMLGSLEDGRYLAVYLHSPEVMARAFRQLLAEGRYARRGWDGLAGIGATANGDQQLAFFRRQVRVWPQELSGVIQLTTTGLDASTALRLNQLLLKEAQAFVNEMNQSISREQLRFAEQEVQRAQARLDEANGKLNAYQVRYGQLDPVQESQATSNYITALEAKLVELKVEEASLRRQFRDGQAPEVQLVADQVSELERQISDERTKLLSPQGRDLSGRALEAMRLRNNVSFATEALRAAMTAVENSRMESQRQLKFLVMLSDSRRADDQDWNWRWQVFLGTIGILLASWGVLSFVGGIRRRT